MKPFTNRQEFSQELRKSHFLVGTHNDSRPKSEYANEYKEQESKPNELAENRKQLRKTHFILGTDEIKDNWGSYSKTQFKEPPKNYEAAVLNAEKKNDLRGLHWKLGNDQPQLVSEHQDKFMPKQISAEQIEQMKEVKIKNKAEHYRFPDENNYFSSVYKEHFNKNIENLGDQLINQRQQIRKDVKKQLVELSSSHILYGTDGTQFGTTSRNTYGPVKQESERVKGADLTKTNFLLGEDPQPTESMYKVFHTGEQTEKASLDPSLVKYLRAHHFKYGDEKVNYASTNANMYQEPPVSALAKKEINASLWKNHFYLGDDKLNYKTSYSVSHNPIEQERTKLAKVDMGSNVKFGYDNPEKISETKGSFVQHAGTNKAQLNEEDRKDLKRSHFNFGDSMQTESYSHSMHKNLLEQAKQINKGTDTKALAADLRKNHYQLGYQNNGFDTSQRSAYKQISTGSASLQKDLLDDLKKHHFELGDKTLPGTNSIYQEQYSWKSVAS